MTNTQTPSGQRPPNATRPTDADLAALLRTASNALRLKSPNVRRDFSDLVTARVMLDAADALDAAPARLTPEQWQEAVERAATKMFDGGFLSEIPPSVLQAETEMDICRIVANLSIRAAFPHLAPNPED